MAIIGLIIGLIISRFWDRFILTAWKVSLGLILVVSLIISLLNSSLALYLICICLGVVSSCSVPAQKSLLEQIKEEGDDEREFLSHAWVFLAVVKIPLIGLGFILNLLDSSYYIFSSIIYITLLSALCSFIYLKLNLFKNKISSN